ncbi:MAG: hypothetical protein QM755_24260 [Luteolibacter sp.]
MHRDGVIYAEVRFAPDPTPAKVSSPGRGGGGSARWSGTWRPTNTA